MFTLEQINNDNFSHYAEYDKAFEKELNNYQSRIYPSKGAVILSWYHIRVGRKYVGSIWLEKSEKENFAVLGIFISEKRYRNKGIGRKAIKQIIINDLQYFGTKKILLNVREDNERAIRCYKKVGFVESKRFEKNNQNVIEMIYEM